MDIIDRVSAKQVGRKFYFTGKACKRGHISERFTSNGYCKECDKQNHARYVESNKQHILTKSKQWRENNPDRCQQLASNWKQAHPEYNKIRYQNNREKYRVYNALSRRSNPDRYKERQRGYYTKNRDRLLELAKSWKKHNRSNVLSHIRFRDVTLKQAIPSWHETELISLLYKKRDELNVLWGVQMEVDHIIPISPRCGRVRGLHCWANLQLIDKQLNRIKSDSYQTDW